MRARGGESKGEATRALILDTALAAFADQGYRGMSLREIAARCDLTHPALLYYFPTKAALLMAVLERRDARDSAGTAFDTLDGWAVLDHLNATVHANEQRRGIVELYATLSAEATSPDHPAHQFFVDRYAGLRAIVTRAYREVAAAGDLRPGIEPKVAAAQLIALMDGLQVQWLLDPEVRMGEAVHAHVASQRIGVSQASTTSPG